MNADLHALTALSPLDGRYAAKVAALAEHFSEYGLIRHRVRVELAWLAALADAPAVSELRAFSPPARAAIDAATAGFRDRRREPRQGDRADHQSRRQGGRVLAEGALRRRAGSRARAEFIHFACTSEDINISPMASRWRARATISCCPHCA